MVASDAQMMMRRPACATAAITAGYHVVDVGARRDEMACEICGMSLVGVACAAMIARAADGCDIMHWTGSNCD